MNIKCNYCVLNNCTQVGLYRSLTKELELSSTIYGFQCLFMLLITSSRLASSQFPYLAGTNTVQATCDL